MTRFELARKTNQELTALLNASGDERTVSFDDCSLTTACRTHAIDKLLTLAGNTKEVWKSPSAHPTLEELRELGLLDS